MWRATTVAARTRPLATGAAAVWKRAATTATALRSSASPVLAAGLVRHRSSVVNSRSAALSSHAIVRAHRSLHRRIAPAGVSPRRHLSSAASAPPSSAAAADESPESQAHLSRLRLPSAEEDPASWHPTLGLAGCALRRPADFRTLEQLAMKNCTYFLQEILSNPPSFATLRLIDSMSNQLCSVVDVAELIRNVHPDSSWRDAASDCSSRMHVFLTSLNHSTELYSAISSLTRLPAHARWSGESRRTAALLKRDMDLAGVGAPEAERERLATLLTAANDASAQFASATHNHRDDEQSMLQLTLSRPEAVRLKAEMGEHWRPWVRIRAVDWLRGKLSSGQASDAVSVSLPMDAGSDVLAFSASSAARRQAFEQMHSGESAHARAAEKALTRLIALRQRLAQQLKQKSFAQFTVGQMVASDSEHVRRLLERALQQLQPEHNANTRQQLRLIRREKLNEQRTASGAAALPPLHSLNESQLAEVDAVSLYPWDEHYYTRLVRASLSQSQSGEGDAKPLSPTAMAQYFSVSNVVRGLQQLTRSLFPTLSLHLVPFAKGEAWVQEGRFGVATTELLKLELREVAPDEPKGARIIGVVYLDLFGRANKYSASASFSLRTACDLLSASGAPDQRQRPVVGVVTGLSRPTLHEGVSAAQQLHCEPSLDGYEAGAWPSLAAPRNGSSSSSSQLVSLLVAREVDVLFHEFGHCLHHLLSRTRFQHVGGARGELDFVELPSTLCEQFLNDHAFVQGWARHVSTDAPLEPEALDQRRREKEAMRGLESVHTTIQALFDQLAHSATLSSNVAAATTNAALEPTAEQQRVLGEMLAALWSSLQRQYSPWSRILPADARPVRPYLRMLHLASYGASYYSYIYCRLFVGVIWRQHEAAMQAALRQAGSDPAARAAAHAEVMSAFGSELRARLFSTGGSIHPALTIAHLAHIDSIRVDATGEGDKLDGDSLKRLQAFAEEAVEKDGQ